MLFTEIGGMKGLATGTKRCMEGECQGGVARAELQRGEALVIRSAGENHAYETDSPLTEVKTHVTILCQIAPKAG